MSSTMSEPKEIADVADVFVKQVFEWLTDPKDRVSVERTSRRYDELSWDSRWLLGKDKDLLEIILDEDDLSYHLEQVLVKVGTLRLYRRCLTSATRNDASAFQPQELMDTLEGMGNRFADKIRRIVVAGSGYKKLIVTGDLIKFVSEKFPMVKSIAFKKCTFDCNAASYVNNMDSFPRLTDLTLSEISFDRRKDRYVVHKLLRSSLEILEYQQMGDEECQKAILKRMARLGIYLQELHLTVGQWEYRENAENTKKRQEAQEAFLRGMASFCRNLSIHLEQPTNVTTSFIKGIELIAQFPQLFHVKISTGINFGDNPHRISFLAAIEDLRRITTLRSLEISANLYDDLLSSIANILPSFKLLESLTIKECHRDTPYGDVENTIKRMPKGLKNLTIHGAKNFDRKILGQICQRLALLQKLTLSDVPLITSADLLQSIPLFLHLEEFETDTIVDTDFVQLLCDRQMLKKLKTVSIVMAKDTPEACWDLMARNFYEASCSVYERPVVFKWLRLSKHRLHLRRPATFDGTLNMDHFHIHHDINHHV